MATTKAQRKLFFNLRKSKKRLGWLNHEEVQAVAADLRVSAADVTEMEARMSNYDQAFDLVGDDEGRGRLRPGALPGRQVFRSGRRHHRERQLGQPRHPSSESAALATLDERSQHIIRARWLDEESKTTCRELADNYGVSAERVRQLGENALRS